MDLTTANPTESKKKQTKATTNETTPSGGSSGLKSPEDIAELYPALEVCHKSLEPAGKDETMFCVPHSLHAAKNNTTKSGTKCQARRKYLQHTINKGLIFITL